MAADSASSTHEQQSFYVVGIGASAGGLESLELFFDHMPAESGLAFVVVQHLSPDFKSLMDQLLARHTQIEIQRAEDGMEVRPNTIYLLQPKHNITMESGKLRLTQHDPDAGFNLPIDIFFRSLAKDMGNRAIGVVLSGTGSDGSRGIQEIHERGGLVVAQDAESAAFDGMPRASAASGIVDVVCRPQTMPTKILQYTQNPEAFRRGQIEESDTDDTDKTQALFRLFRQRFGINFSHYKSATIQRRIDRRMQLSQIDTLDEYFKVLEQSTEEVELLYRDLLVEVTYFFRDPDSFKRLETDVIPKMLSDCPDNDEVRVWVAGCATGEEAYSFAMLLHDVAERQKSKAKIKVFASDVHQNSMAKASSAIYGAKSIEHVPEAFRDKYFTRQGDSYRVNAEIRRMVVFARHDLTRDPPFTRINLLSCRNVLIYLEPEIQRRILSMFHFGLRVGGTLMLGPSETLGTLSKEFKTIDQHWRVYEKLRDIRLPESDRMPMTPPSLNVLMRASDTSANGGSKHEDAWLLPSTFEDLLARYVPPSLLVNEFFELIHTFGDARRLLVQPPGRTTLDVSRMVDGDLQTALTAALHRANQQEVAVSFKSVVAKTPLGTKRLDLTVEPYTKGSRKLFLVCLEEQIEPQSTDVPEPVGVEYREERRGRIEELERELDHTRQSLQTTVEELETSNEELQSTNEELIASNEELQSTNEELHSVNEELYTVNSEYQRKIDELTNLTNDLDNLLSSTDIGTIFLDHELKIRKFTPAIATAFHVLDHDIGRPIDHISYNLENPELIADLKRVLKDGAPIEKEVRAPDGRTFLKRIRPYYTESGSTRGLVLTFDETTAIKNAASVAERAEEELAISQRELQEFAYAVSHDLQAPLRHLQEFIDRSEESGSEKELRTNLSAMRDSSRRMEAMIDAMLMYSRVSTHGKDLGQVDVRSLIDAAIDNLRPAIDSSQAVISIESMPRLHGDARQLTRCFQELIDNAIKFSHTSPPRINISARIRNGGWLIAVRDNGIGIEQRHYDKVFVIFQRLGFKENTEGVGLGLALCRRILERHKGWIWVESTPARGSTFYLQFPKNERSTTS